MISTYHAMIEEITQSVFSTMLNMEVMPIDCDSFPQHDTLATAIQITGEWVGSVVLSLSPTAVRAAAEALLRIPGAEVTNADEQDVAAELVNIIGGNLKSLLPAPSTLSLPTVVAGREFGVRVHSAELIDDVWLGSESGCLRVRLYAKKVA